MELIKLKTGHEDWNRNIVGFNTKTLFHESFWHDHIATIHRNSKMEYFSVNKNGSVVGFFCGLVVHKGFIKVMGSPLRGTGTNYMGPIVDHDIDQSELLSAIRRMCRKEKIYYIEMNNDLFSSEKMILHGYEKNSSVTHKVPLPDSEEEALANLKSTCRNRIRKAEKNNLLVEEAADESVVDHFVAQFKEVYGKQGMEVPFGKKRVLSLYRCLYPNSRLLPLWVKKGDTVIATGLFPYDENAIYFWGATSWLKYQKYCPNEILHWHVIRFAVRKKIKVYNMCGGTSQFKNKFGGEDEENNTYSKPFLPFLKLIANVYKESHYLKLKLLGKIKDIRKGDE